MKRGRKDMKVDFVPTMKTDVAKSLLGESMPHLPPTEVGKYRLHSALKNRFGANYRNMPQAQAALNEFEGQRHYYKTLAGVQLKRKK